MQETTRLRQFVVGNLSTNCYALISEGECLVVDPGASGARIAQELADVHVSTVVATHGHHDHVGGVAALLRALPYGVSFCIGKNDATRARHALELSSHVFDTETDEVEDAPAAQRVLGEGDVVCVGAEKLRVLDTPGHTEGGICLVGDGFAFMGDTVFAGSVGRTDLAGGDQDVLLASLDHIKACMDPATVLLCGHGPATTLETELQSNPWFCLGG